MAGSLEESDFTSIQQRLEERARKQVQSLPVSQGSNSTNRRRPDLATFDAHGQSQEEEFLPLALGDYAVVINYLNSQPAANATVEEILAANGTAVAVRADVADELDVERLFGETIDAFGGVDVVVHAAARMILGTVADYDLQAFDALHRVNARGTFVVNQQSSLQLRDGGAIVNFSSSAVRLALPSYAAYAASKGAADAITRVLARELSARDITVNAIALGLERPATPAHIANLVAFLVSQDGRWVNGQVIPGGWLMGDEDDIDRQRSQRHKQQGSA
jgi:3-oxoacyl-[acyl-carrier protein] reductase